MYWVITPCIFGMQVDCKRILWCAQLKRLSEIWLPLIHVYSNYSTENVQSDLLATFLKYDLTFLSENDLLDRLHEGRRNGNTSTIRFSDHVSTREILHPATVRLLPFGTTIKNTLLSEHNANRWPRPSPLEVSSYSQKFLARLGREA